MAAAPATVLEFDPPTFSGGNPFGSLSPSGIANDAGNVVRFARQPVPLRPFLQGMQEGVLPEAANSNLLGASRFMPQNMLNGILPEAANSNAALGTLAPETANIGTGLSAAAEVGTGVEVTEAGAGAVALGGEAAAASVALPATIIGGGLALGGYSLYRGYVRATEPQSLQQAHEQAAAGLPTSSELAQDQNLQRILNQYPPGQRAKLTGDILHLRQTKEFFDATMDSTAYGGMPDMLSLDRLYSGIDALPADVRQALVQRGANPNQNPQNTTTHNNAPAASHPLTFTDWDHPAQTAVTDPAAPTVQAPPILAPPPPLPPSPPQIVEAVPPPPPVPAPPEPPPVIAAIPSPLLPPLISQPQIPAPTPPEARIELPVAPVVPSFPQEQIVAPPPSTIIPPAEAKPASVKPPVQTLSPSTAVDSAKPPVPAAPTQPAALPEVEAAHSPVPVVPHTAHRRSTPPHRTAVQPSEADILNDASLAVSRARDGIPLGDASEQPLLAQRVPLDPQDAAAYRARNAGNPSANFGAEADANIRHALGAGGTATGNNPAKQPAVKRPNLGM